MRWVTEEVQTALYCLAFIPLIGLWLQGKYDEWRYKRLHGDDDADVEEVERGD